LPILHKIENGCLNLTNYTLNGSLAKALANGIIEKDKTFKKIIFDTNGMRDEDFACILYGFSKLEEIKSIVYIRNEFNVKSMLALRPLFTQKPVPHHLEELKLINCGIILTLPSSYHILS
jgi:hypothetical protein